MFQTVFGKSCRRMTVRNLPDYERALVSWKAHDRTKRLWNRDATLWTGQDEARWLGWLDVVKQQLEEVARLKQFATEVRAAGFERVLLLGMGGSSLGAEVLASVFGHTADFPRLHILDSIDPMEVHRFASEIDLVRTLFIVSSKSGTTLEVSLLTEFFLGKLKQKLEARNVGAHFAAVTDPDTSLQRLAEKEKFGWIFAGIPSIGGRFSVLSNFGLVPAAAIGLDVERLLLNASQMVEDCRGECPRNNPGVMLGLALGVAAKQRRDKVTLVTSPNLGRLEFWIEQLLAESTGKNGSGLVPVCGEPVGTPADYGNDRLFCYLRNRIVPEPSLDEAVGQLETAGFPVVRIEVGNVYDLGREFFRWEFATAVAGSVLGVNPFDQPDVEAAKVATREFLAKPISRKPSFRSKLAGGLKLFNPPGDDLETGSSTMSVEALRTALRLHFEQLHPGDFFAVLAFVERNDVHEKLLQAMRIAVRDAFQVATVAGFGPRYLHSTGQLFKGGSNEGVFLVITSDETVDMQVPGMEHTFGAVKTAQAEGDFRTMAKRGRRLLRLHVGPNVTTGLGQLSSEILMALKWLCAGKSQKQFPNGKENYDNQMESCN